jgi:thioredoxin 1
MKKHVGTTLLATFCLLSVSAMAAELPSSNDAIIKAALASGKPTVADFGARTCIPCKKMAPILAELQTELKGKANVTFTDVWAKRVSGAIVVLVGGWFFWQGTGI